MDGELEKMAAGVKIDDDGSTGRKHERRRKKSKDLLDTSSGFGLEVEHTDGADTFITKDVEARKLRSAPCPPPARVRDAVAYPNLACVCSRLSFVRTLPVCV